MNKIRIAAGLVANVLLALTLGLELGLKLRELKNTKNVIPEEPEAAAEDE